MKNFLIVLLVGLVSLNLSDGKRRKARDASLTFRSTPRSPVEGVTEDVTLDCKPPPAVKNLFMAILIRIEKEESEGQMSLVALQRSGRPSEVSGDNRTTAEGNLETNGKGGTSFLTLKIDKPVVNDSAVYHCKFVYLDMNFTVVTSEAKVNVVVAGPPPPGEVVAPTTGCDCEEIWEEIHKLKEALAKRPAQSTGTASDDTCQASFSAAISAKGGYQIEDDDDIVFDKIISNKGEAYDAATGTFTAPCAGQYFFTTTLRTHLAYDSGSAEGVITVDGQPVARTSAYTDSAAEYYDANTNGVVVALEAGQKVKVMIHTTSHGEFQGGEYSIFTGFYLHA